MSDDKERLDFPLRVRVTAAEDARILQAAEKLGVTKSIYVRWAIENSTSQLLGTTLKGEVVKPVVKPKPPPRAPAPPPPVEIVELPGEYYETNNGVEVQPEGQVELQVETVPDVLTAMGFTAPVDLDAPQALPFDDTDWER